MKTTIKCENNKFLVITLKHVSGLRIVVNPHGAPKQCAIAHENGQKTLKWRVFGNNPQTCIGSCEPCKSPRTPKLWTIAHKNGHRTRKQRVLGDALKHISGLTVVVNLPLTPKLWAITHEKTIKRKISTFWSYLSNMYRALRLLEIALEPQNCGQ